MLHRDLFLLKLLVRELRKSVDEVEVGMVLEAVGDHEGCWHRGVNGAEFADVFPI